jgi:hypothetical protein
MVTIRSGRAESDLGATEARRRQRDSQDVRESRYRRGSADSEPAYQSLDREPAFGWSKATT